LDLPSFVALAVLGVATLGLARAGSAEVRARIRTSLPWLVWGLVWSLVLAATLVFFYPSWEPYRCAFVVVGFGVAATMLLGAITPRLLIVLLAVRLTMFVLAPGPATGVRSRADEAGASIDIPKLTRLQRLVASIRSE